MDIFDAITYASRLVAYDDDEMTNALYQIWMYASNLTNLWMCVRENFKDVHRINDEFVNVDGVIIMFSSRMQDDFSWSSL